MKTPQQILQSIPLNCIAHLESKRIADIFGISISTTSHIMSHKYEYETQYLSAHERRAKEVVDETTIVINEEYRWMGSPEREYIKSVTL